MILLYCDFLICYFIVIVKLKDEASGFNDEENDVYAIIV